MYCIHFGIGLFLVFVNLEHVISTTDGIQLHPAETTASHLVAWKPWPSRSKLKIRKCLILLPWKNFWQIDRSHIFCSDLEKKNETMQAYTNYKSLSAPITLYLPQVTMTEKCRNANQELRLFLNGNAHFWLLQINFTDGRRFRTAFSSPEGNKALRTFRQSTNKCS